MDNLQEQGSFVSNNQPKDNNSKLTNNNEEEEPVAKSRKVETNPLQIENVVEKVFSFLPVDSIKTCRQVNTLWKAEGAKVLLTKCYVGFTWNFRTRRSSDQSSDVIKFKDFLSWKSKSVSGIPKISIGDPRDVELWKSVGVLEQVTSLKLTLTEDNDDEILLNFFGLLPNLKNLTFPLYNKFYNTKAHIIKFLNSVMSNNKWKSPNPLVISSMTLQPDTVKELVYLEQLSKYPNMMIEQVNIVMSSSLSQLSFARVLNVMNTFLSNSRNALKKLILGDCQFFLSRLEFPCMTALTKMYLEFNGQTPHHVRIYEFSPSFKFSEKVPNLQEIILDSGRIVPWPSSEFLVNLFRNTGPAPSVKRLEYSSRHQDFIIDPFFQVFPNVEEFKAFEVRSSQRMFHSIWKNGQNLKKLDIPIYLNWERNGLDLDSIFTGFSSATVETIKKSPNFPSYTLEELEKLRINPSILNLKELEALSILFEGCVSFLPMKTLAVAGAYAFKLLPKNPLISVGVKTSEYHRYKNTMDAVLTEVSKLSNVIVNGRRPEPRE